MAIEKHKREWLAEKISDLDDFFSLFSPVFDAGGYVAGGILRRGVHRGDLFSLFDKNRKWQLSLHKPGHEQPFTTATSAPDVDFFFYNIPEDISLDRDAAKIYFDKRVITAIRRLPGVKTVGVLNDSRYALTYEMCLNDCTTIRFQFVIKHFGKPEDVIRDFDLCNCMIAMDHSQCWCHERFLKNERSRQIEIASKTNGWTNTNYLGNRIAKYLATGHYDTIVNKKLFLEWAIQKSINQMKDVKSGKYPERLWYETRNLFEGLLMNPFVIDDADIPTICCTSLGVVPKVLLERKKRKDIYTWKIRQAGSPNASNKIGDIKCRETEIEFY